MGLRVGTSGWHYRHWAGVVYPPGVPTRRWFQLYATRFDTVEVNASFYRLPAESTIDLWRAQAPDGFCYAMKGSRFTTHNLKIGGDRLPSSVELVSSRLARLEDRLGVVLWQLPPTLHVDVDRLARFLSMLPTDVRHAVELRHPSWYVRDVDAVLSEAGVARVWGSGLGMPPVTGLTAGFVYLRFHGLGDDDPYRWDYADAELAPWVDAVRAALADGVDVFTYFNNDGGGHAVTNAERFRDLCLG
jgi:uncharacterized protein YecE (DUF72 family)